MPKTQLQNDIAAVIARTLDIPEPIPTDISRNQESKWNSLKHVEIIFALEDHFSIQFTEDDMTALDSLASATTIVQRYLHAA